MVLGMLQVADPEAWAVQAAAKLKEAQRLGLRLDVWSYNTLIKGYCLANDAGNARDVLEAMKLQNVQPNVVRTP